MSGAKIDNYTKNKNSFKPEFLTNEMLCSTLVKFGQVDRGIQHIETQFLESLTFSALLTHFNASDFLINLCYM